MPERTDSERIDWLEGQAEMFREPYTPGKTAIAAEFTVILGDIINSRNPMAVREAIDRAMEREGEDV